MHRAVASLQMASIGTFQLLTFVKLQGFQTEPGLVHQPELTHGRARCKAAAGCRWPLTSCSR